MAGHAGKPVLNSVSAWTNDPGVALAGGGKRSPAPIGAAGVGRPARNGDDVNARKLPS